MSILRTFIIFLMIAGTGCAHQSNVDNHAKSLDTTEPKWLDSINRQVFNFNESVDKWFLAPAAKGYKAITPDGLERSIDNFFDNLTEPATFANAILQGNPNNAINSLGRVLVNSSLGIGGLFDVATELNINSNSEDMGQTLAVWGVPSGYYVVVPFLGGVTLRNGIGGIADGYASPIAYVNNNAGIYSLAALDLLNLRANLLGVEEIKGGDYYEFRKQVYLQRRHSKIHDGDIIIEEDELDWLDEQE